MPKDNEKNNYYHVIVRKGSPLAGWLAEMKQEANLSEPQAIILAASQYIKGAGSPPASLMMPQPGQPVAVPPMTSPMVISSGASIALNGHGASAEDLDDYGEPD